MNTTAAPAPRNAVVVVPAPERFRTQFTFSVFVGGADEVPHPATPAGTRFVAHVKVTPHGFNVMPVQRNVKEFVATTMEEAVTEAVRRVDAWMVSVNCPGF